MTTTTIRGGALLLTAAVLGAAPVAGQMMHGPLVSADWLEGHLEDEHVAILHADTRPAGYEAGHIPGARFLDMSMLVWDGDPAWRAEIRSPDDVQEALEAAGVTDDHHHILVYANSALVGARAFMTLEVMGLQGRVQLLDGGLTAWRDSGRPLTTDAPEASRGSITLSPRDDVVVGADWIHERLDDPSIALVDARPDDEYTGDDGGMDGMANPGHIPGAHQLYWEELIVSRDDPRMLPTEEVRALFERAGAGEGKTVVTYCMIGMRASYTYLASRLLGYDTKFYDGSWHDWGTREDLPYVSGRSPR